MNAVDFPESNITFGPPAGMHKEQCRSIRAFLGTVEGGSLDSSQIVVTAHQPTPAEIEAIVGGAPIFISVFGGLPPHFLCTSFQQAIRPA